MNHLERDIDSVGVVVVCDIRRPNKFREPKIKKRFFVLCFGWNWSQCRQCLYIKLASSYYYRCHILSYFCLVWPFPVTTHQCLCCAVPGKGGGVSVQSFTWHTRKRNTLFLYYFFLQNQNRHTEYKIIKSFSQFFLFLFLWGCDCAAEWWETDRIDNEWDKMRSVIIG